MPLRLPDLDLPPDLVARLVALSERDGDPAFAYARISRDRVGAHLGADRQLEDQCALYEQRAIGLAGVFVDNDLSAYSGKPRPDYEEMLTGLEAGLARLVTVWHPDRLHRSPVELERYIAVCDPRDVPTLTVRAGEIDLSTANGRMVARVTGAVARHESELKSERIRAQKRQAVASGKWRGGSRPFGFEADGVTHRQDEAEVIRDCAQRLLAGETLYSIAFQLYARGIVSPLGKRWRPGNLRTTLMRARHAGLIESGGKVVGKALWDPILDRDVWEAVVALLKSEDRKQYAEPNMSRVLVGSGLYWCGAANCGRHMFSGGTTKTGQLRYRCVDWHVSRTAPAVDEHVHDVIAGILDRFGVDLLPPAPNLAPLRDRLRALEIRKREIAEVFADPDADMSADQFRVANDGITRRIKETQDKLSNFSGRSALAGIADAPSPGAVYRAQPIERQRSVIDTLAKVTLLKASGGRRPDGSYFDPETVVIEPKDVGS